MMKIVHLDTACMHALRQQGSLSFSLSLSLSSSPFRGLLWLYALAPQVVEGRPAQDGAVGADVI